MVLTEPVVSIATSVAHLAGAMGKPVWIPLRLSAEWRWLQDRNDSVWYPTARLFRQPASGDWKSVIARVRQELETYPWPCSVVSRAGNLNLSWHSAAGAEEGLDAANAVASHRNRQ